MIYIETEPCRAEGFTDFFRVYADGQGELAAMLTSLRAHPPVLEAGQPNEHVVLSGTHVRKIKGAVAIDDRGKVKLFAHKSRQGIWKTPDSEPVSVPEAEPASSSTEQVGALDQDVTHPKTGRLIIKGRAQAYNAPAEAPESPTDGDDDE